MTSHRASVRRSLTLLLMLIATAPAAVGMGKVASAATTGPAAASSPVLPPGFTATKLAGGLKDPIAVTFAPTGEMWVATQPGGIYRMSNGSLQ
ncbi:MAG: hypothetical protein M3Z97_06685, partial [Candidatus Dormibacteraeota bacterium]|nr:hypothetical protein [Candidatus Dormibacteraeota bacterium]